MNPAKKPAKRFMLVLSIFLLMAGLAGAEHDGSHTGFEGFEDGNINEYSGDTGVFSAVTSPSFVGTYSLQVDGSTSGTSIDKSISYTEPDTLQVLAKSNADNRNALTTWRVGGTPILNINLQTDAGNDGYRISINQDNAFVLDGSVSADTLYKIEFRDIDWTNEHTDVYVNGTQEATDVPFINSPANNTLSKVAFYQNDDDQSNVNSWWDEVSIADPNQAPSIDDTAINPPSPEQDDRINTSMNASDPDGDDVKGWVTVEEDGVVINDSVPMDEPTANEFELDNVFVADETNVWYNVTFTAGDGTANTTSETAFQVEDTAPSITVSDPQNQTYSSDPPYTVLFNDTDDVAGESVDWALWLNDAPLDSGTDTLNFTETGTVTGSNKGSNNFTVNATDPQGNTATASVTYTFDTEPPVITIDEPAGNFTRKTFLPLNYTVTDLSSTMCTFNVDGTGNTTLQNCGNTTFNVTDIGTHTLDLWANDTSGNVNHTSSSFFADHLNEIRLEDDNTGDTIQDFEITYDNGTDTFGGSTSTGAFRFNTTDVPTGSSVDLTLKAAGYDTRTVQENVDASYEINQSFTMSPAEVSINAFDEDTEDDIRVNLTVSNDTTSQDVTQNTANTTQITGSSNAEDAQYTVGTHTYRGDYAAAETVKVNADSFQNLASIELVVHYVNGTPTQYSKSVNSGPDEGPQTLEYTVEDQLFDKVEIKATTDTDDATHSLTVNDTRLVGTDANVFSNTFNALATSSFPTGDITVTADTAGYRPRQYFATINNNTQLTLDTYLLDENDGITMTVEVVDSNNDAVQGATITIQREFSNTFKTVAQKTSSTAGTGSFFLNPDIQYKVLVTHPSFVGFEGTFSPANYQFEPLTVQLGSASAFGFETPWDDISVKITPDSSTVPRQVVTFNGTIVDNSNNLDSFTFTISNATHTLNTSTVTGSPSGGTISLDANLTQQDLADDINATLEFVQDGSTFTYRTTYRIAEAVEKGAYSLLKTMQDFRDTAGPVITGFLALFLTTVFASVLGQLGVLGRKGSGFLTLLFLGFFALPQVNWINPFYWLIALAAVIGLYGVT